MCRRALVGTQMSFLETLVILVVAVIVLGPKRLPEVARKIGHWTGVLRRATDEFKRQLMTMDQHVERTVDRVTQDIDALVPADEELLPSPSYRTAPPAQHPDELPPTASPDDFWSQPPVAGGLPEEMPSAPAPATEPPKDPSSTVVLNPTSFEREPTESKPRSLGLSPTVTSPSAAKEAPRG